MAGYSLLASESTVQVFSPTVVEDVVYCTIQTQPSGVIASMPISKAAFDTDATPPVLTAFADNIETIMGRGHVIGGTGSQTIDANGLLQDRISFVVQYMPTPTSSSAITAEALVPVGLLGQSDPAIERTLLSEAEAIIDKVYANLQAAAGG